MGIVKKADVKCPNSKCKAQILKEWNLGILPRFLSVGSVFFRCRKCNDIFNINIPLYMIEKFLDAMPKDPSYKDGEFITRNDPITEDEEQLFVKMLKEQPIELLQALSTIEKIELDQYE